MSPSVKRYNLVSFNTNDISVTLFLDLTSSKLNQETPIRQQNALDIQKPTAPTLNRNYQDSDKLLVDVEQDNEFPEADDAKETELAGTMKT